MFLSFQNEVSVFSQLSTLLGQPKLHFYSFQRVRVLKKPVLFLDPQFCSTNIMVFGQLFIFLFNFSINKTLNLFLKVFSTT